LAAEIGPVLTSLFRSFEDAIFLT